MPEKQSIYRCRPFSFFADTKAVLQNTKDHIKLRRREAYNDIVSESRRVIGKKPMRVGGGATKWQF